jgi:hypothetical protein
MPLTIWDRIREGVGYRLVRLGFHLRKVRGNYSIIKPIDPSNVEILGDPSFQKSVQEVANLTLLDTGRLANLWKLSRLTDPKGNIIEIGSYRGGGALHLSNSSPERRIIVCDSFRSFEKLDPSLDQSFHQEMFKDTDKQSVARLFSSRKRAFEVIDGFFPASCAGKTIAPVSFVHLDVDVYKATVESLNYLEEQHILMEKSFIVLDDYDRNAEGVNRAVAEFTASHKHWIAIPLFPSQCLMLKDSWFA